VVVVVLGVLFLAQSVSPVQQILVAAVAVVQEMLVQAVETEQTVATAVQA
jgi:hypothetical protein